jgi:hypothetical protein
MDFRNYVFFNQRNAHKINNFKVFAFNSYNNELKLLINNTINKFLFIIKI